MSYGFMLISIIFQCHSDTIGIGMIMCMSHTVFYWAIYFVGEGIEWFFYLGGGVAKVITTYEEPYQFSTQWKFFYQYF